MEAFPPPLPPHTRTPSLCRSDCWIITFPQQHLTNAIIWRPDPFSLQLEKVTEWKRGREGGKWGGKGWESFCCCNQGSEQHWSGTLWLVRLGETQTLTSSQAGLHVTVSCLSEIFFQAINYYIWTLHPSSREPLASCSKNQSSFTTFTLAVLQLFIYFIQ